MKLLNAFSLQMPEAEAFKEEGNFLMVYKFGEYKLTSHE